MWNVWSFTRGFFYFWWDDDHMLLYLYTFIHWVWDKNRIDQRDEREPDVIANVIGWKSFQIQTHMHARTYLHRSSELSWTGTGISGAFRFRFINSLVFCILLILGWDSLCHYDELLIIMFWFEYNSVDVCFNVLFIYNTTLIH